MTQTPPIDDIARTLVAIAEADSDIVAVARKPEGGWVVARGEEDRVEIDLDASDGRLVLMQWAGRPNPARRTEALAALLTYSSMWAETGHVRAALDGPEGDAMLIADILPQVLTEAHLRAVIAGLAEKAEIVRELIEADAAGADGPEAMIRI